MIRTFHDPFSASAPLPSWQDRLPEWAFNALGFAGCLLGGAGLATLIVLWFTVA